MKKLIMGMLAAASLSVPALADDSKITKGYYTNDSIFWKKLKIKNYD